MALTPTMRFSLIMTGLGIVLSILTALFVYLKKINDTMIRQSDLNETLIRHDEANKEQVNLLNNKLAEHLIKLTALYDDMNARQGRSEGAIEVFLASLGKDKG